MLENLSRQVIKGYELYERIGAGAYGAVYRAYQSTVGREVAVKVILPGFASRPDFIRRFELEAQLVARLEHLHIVPLYDFWRDPGGAYLVMRWLRGGSLQDALQEGPYDLASTVRLVDQVAAGLSAAHRQGIVHRDLKPANILLDEDSNAYLSDFGIARDFNGAAEDPGEGEGFAGSPGYLSPEQLRGGLVTPQSDLYSLGLVIYELLAGKPPFPGLNPVERMYRQLEAPLPEVDLPDPQIKERVNAVLQKATEKNPRRRYRDALELAAAFRQAAETEQPETPNPAEQLTSREVEILGLIVRGSSNKEIAQALFIELTTVKWYITQLYRKLNVRSRMQAILRAHELQLLRPLVEAEGQPAVGGAALSSPGMANPYKGLRAFGAADSRDFFGREALIEKLVRRLGESRFLAVVGPSGSGKSSLVQAGLAPALHAGALSGSERWFVVQFSPGARPLDALEVALARIAPGGENVRAHLERDAAGLLRAAGLLLPEDGSELVLVIDPCEELYTLVEAEADRQQFLDLLSTATSDPKSRVRIVLTLRADFYDRPLQDLRFGDLVRRNLETVLPLSAEELERAIARPAEAAGVVFEPGLVAKIIEDVQYQPAALPLLQYALTELFDQRRGQVLTHAAYEAIDGAAGALARRAEELYRGLSPAGQEAARQVFLRLVALGETGEAGRLSPDVRRRALRADLLALGEGGMADQDQVDDLLETFAAYRLLSLDYDPLTRKPVVALAHEALLSQWERLGTWIDESREDLRQHRRFSALCGEWLEAERDPGYLLPHARLEAFSNWADHTSLKLSPGEKAFLEASRAARREQDAVEEQRRQRELKTARRLAETERQRADEGERAARRLRRRAVWLTAALAAAIGLALAAFAFFRQAEAQRRLAVVRELAAAAVANLEADPELSLLLSLAAADEAARSGERPGSEVEDALHRSIQASRVVLMLPHGGAVAVSPDGKRIATGGADGRVLLWDTGTGKELISLDGATGEIKDLRFSPDGKRLVAASLDGMARVWDTGAGELLLTLDPDDGGVYSLAFSPKGDRLATGSEKAAVIWDAHSGTELVRGVLHTQSITGLTFSPQGETLITNSVDGYMKILNTNTQLVEDQSRLPLRRYVPLPSGVALSPSGRLVATSSGQLTATVWDLRMDEIVTTFYGHSGAILDVAFSADGGKLATGSEDGTARVWDVFTGQELLRLSGHRLAICRLAFTPDGTRLVTTSQDGTTRVWDIRPEGGREWFTLIGEPGDSKHAAFSADGKQLIANLSHQSILVNADTGAWVAELPGEPVSRTTPDGARLATLSLEATVTVWEVTSGRRIVTVNSRKGIHTADLSPDGRRLATGSRAGLVEIWDATSGEMLLAFQAHPIGVFYVNYSPDGSRLVSTGFNGQAIAWDAATGQQLVTLGEEGDFFEAAAFSPDRKWIATAGGDGTIAMWDAASGRVLFEVEAHPGGVRDVSFSPNGKRLATAGLDSTARLWDATAGQELLTLTGHQAALNSVAFSPDGKRLVTSSDDNTVRVYALDLVELIEMARSRLTRGLTEVECRRYLHRESCAAGP